MAKKWRIVEGVLGLFLMVFIVCFFQLLATLMNYGIAVLFFLFILFVGFSLFINALTQHGMIPE